jgi:hypothetical protein
VIHSADGCSHTSPGPSREGLVPEPDAGRTPEGIAGRVPGQEAVGEDVIHHSSSLSGLSSVVEGSEAIANTTYMHACESSVCS